MVDINTLKLKDLLEKKFGASITQEIINVFQTSINSNQSKSELKQSLWQNVIKPKLANADEELFGIWYFLVELSVFIPAPAEANI